MIDGRKQFDSISEEKDTKETFAPNVKGKRKWRKKKEKGNGEDATKNPKKITSSLWLGGPYEEAMQK
jgi:hypothetical protein